MEVCGVSEMNDFNQRVIREFRQNQGVVGGPLEGSPLVLLTTTGAKTGQARTHPVMAQVGDDGVLYVFASKGGAPTDPDWYRNLVANPAVHVEFGTDSFGATAEPVTGPFRDEIYARQEKVFPAFAEYQQKTSRVIPVVALRRDS
jgi:deazaflavin-dependent oxidoreductase (nitroreductase family)